MKKRILSVILCLILLLQASAAFSASYDFVNFEDKLYDDGVDEANGKIYYVAGANTIGRKIKFSMDMGLIAEYAPNASVTKQNIKDALRLVFGTDGFYKKYYQDGKEDEALGIDEAIVLFMDATGYGKYLEFTGTTSLLDYHMEAKRRGLLDGIDYEKSKTMFTAETFYTMFYNALDMKMFGGILYNNEGGLYNFTEETLMTSYLGLKYISAVVTANSYTSINGSEPTAEGRIAIANTEYIYTDIKDADTFLGYSVDAYVDKDNILRSIAVNESYNETMILDDGHDIKTPTSRTRIQYYDEKDKLRTLNLNPYVNVIYNHVACPDFKAEDFKIKNGYVKLIDNNHDNVYDIAFVNEYTSFMPYIVYDSEYKIEDIMGNTYDLSEMIVRNKYRGMKDMDGEDVDISEININTPVSVLTVYDKKEEVTELLFLKENTYEGVYSASKSDPETYRIGDYDFEITEYFRQKADGKFPHKMGTRILVYLDQFGKIIKSAAVEDVIKYGYLMSIAGSGSPVDDDVCIKMFTENDKWEVFDVASNLYYNDRKVNESTIVSGGAKEIYDSGEAIAQLVRYRVNANNELIEIDTADKSNMALGAYRETDDFQLNYSGSLKYYDGHMKSFGGKYRFNKAVTKVFNIPTDPSYTDYFRVSVDGIYNGNNLDNISFFDVDKNYTSGAICIFRNPTTTWADGYMSQGRFIIDTGQTYDLATEEVLDFVSLSSYDWETSAVADPENCNVYRKGDAEFGGRYLKVNKFTDLRRGDIIEYTTNYEGRITAFLLNFAVDPEMSLAEQAFETNRRSGEIKPTEWHGEDIITFAKVISRDVESLVINADKDSSFTNRDSNRIITPPTSQKTTIYYVGDDRYEYATFADIQVGDFVLVEMNEITLRNLVVYRP